MRIALLVSLALLVGSAYAVSETQTDWSGGGSVPGPVGSWDDTFELAQSIDHDSDPGCIRLDLPYGLTTIDDFDSPSGIVAADFDLDGDIDVATAGLDGISWWSNDGTGGSWTEHSVTTSSLSRTWMWAADIDRDGDQDLVTSVQGSRLSWWCNPLPGSSWSERPITYSDVRGCSVADFDGDGWTDVLVTVYDSGDVVWWRNRFPTTWTPTYIDGSFGGAYSCTAGDFDGDGTMDAAAGSWTSGEVAVYYAVGDGWMKTRVEEDFGNPIWLATADMNGDGALDMIGTDYGQDHLFWWQNNGVAIWQRHNVASDLQDPSYVGAADLSGDGRPDLLHASYRSGSSSIRWYESMDQQGTSWITRDFFSAGRTFQACAADLTGDGLPELACGSYAGNDVRTWRIAGYETPGYLVSSILDTGATTLSWDFIHFDSEQPAGTNVAVRVRGSHNPGTMGDWSSYIYEPGSLQGILESTDRYVQYRVDLTTGNLRRTPTLNDITLVWGVTGVSESASGLHSTPGLSVISESPCAEPTLAYTVASAGRVSISVYDVSGRCVTIPVDREVSPGTYTVTTDGLPSGAYIVRMESSDGSFTAGSVVTR